MKSEAINALVLDDLKQGLGVPEAVNAFRELEWRKCSKDPIYWIEHYCHIKAKDGRVVPFDLWPAQRRLVKLWHQNISTIGVKARQLGVTTLGSAFMMWMVLFREASEWNLIAATEPKARETVERIQPTLHRLPEWMLERAKRRVGVEREVRTRRDADNAAFRFRAGYSRMEILTSTEKSIAGAAGNLFWDEATRHDDLERKWQLAFPVYDGGGMCIVIANGEGEDFFFELCQKAIAGDSRMEFFFFDWMEDPKRLDGAHIVEEDGTLTPVRYEGGDGYADRDEAMRAHLAGREKPEGRHLDCPWYNQAMREYLVANPESDVFAFRAQYPSTVEDAFLISGKSRFNPKWMNDHAARMRSEELGKELWPDIGYLKRLDSGPEWQHWGRGVTKVWEHPIRGASYVLGVDSAGGKQSGDYSAIQVLLSEAPDRVRQVAVFHAKVEPADLAEKTLDLARYYNDAFVVIERNQHGHGVIERIKGRYFNLYKHIETSKFSDEIKDNIGFPAGGTNKAPYIDRLAEWTSTGTDEDAREPQIAIRCHETLSEMSRYEIKDNGSYGAPKGQNDDLVTSLGIALLGHVSRNRERSSSPVRIYMPWE